MSERFLIDVETGKERRMTPDEIREWERRDRDAKQFFDDEARRRSLANGGSGRLIEGENGDEED